MGTGCGSRSQLHPLLQNRGAFSIYNWRVLELQLESGSLVNPGYRETTRLRIGAVMFSKTSSPNVSAGR